MAYEIYWQSSRVICARLRGNITVEDLHGSNLAIRHLMDMRTAPANILFDVREVRTLPSKLRTIQHHCWGVDRSRMGWMVVVGIQARMANMAGLIWQLSRARRYKLFATMEEAQAFLATLASDEASSHAAGG